MGKNTLKVDDEFEEVSTHTVDGRQRVTLGDLGVRGAMEQGIGLGAWLGR